MKNVVYGTAVMGMSLLVSGCGAEPPSCSDGEVQDTVMDISLNEIRSQLLPKLITKVKYENEGQLDFQTDFPQELDMKFAMTRKADVKEWEAFRDSKKGVAMVFDTLDKMVDDMNLQLEGIRTVGANKDTLMSACAAQISGNGQNINITYQAQVTDSGKVYVEVAGLR